MPEKLPRLIRVTFFISLLFCFASAANFAKSNPESETTTKIIFILDASGSMWGKIGNEEKIVSAKKVLKTAIEELPENAEVGLIAYGHRSKGDCKDIETLSTLKAVDKTGLAGKIDSLDPKGKTPITDSLRAAIAEVKALDLDETVKIVLVSDGLETCTGDPCKLVREAKAAGVNITLHVIGFDTGKIDFAQLECLAQAGGGLYLNANNSDELSAALDQAVSADVAGYNNFLSVKTIADGKLNDSMVNVRNSVTGEKLQGGRTYEAEETNPRKIPLPVGTYDVTVQSIRIDGAPIITYEKVEIKEGETTERTADFSAGLLTVKVTLNGELKDATVKAISASTKKVVAGSRTYTTRPPTIRLIPGRYSVEIQPLAVNGIEKVLINDVVIKPGDEETFIEHNFDGGTLRVGTKLGTKLIDSVVSVKDPATGKSIANGRTYTSGSSNPRQFVIKPGTYRVEVFALNPKGLVPKSITVTVGKGETVEEMIEYQ
ncbi:MAG: VWA domain-containing protein [Pyrinomonadaceae bacterium]